MRRIWQSLGLAAGMVAAGIAAAQTPADLQRSFEGAARKESPAFAGFSAQRGEAFFKNTHGSDWTCASCHTQSPLGSGRHAVTGKQIAPLAPAANSARFTDPAKVDKWFKRNCNDVVSRPCTALEKGDVLAYLIPLDK